MDESLLYLLKGLLTRNSIRINDEELRLQLFGHPSYPSLHSITGVLDHFNIPNLAIEIPKTEENISFLPDHFIAHIDDKRGDRFVIIDKLNQEFKNKMKKIIFLNPMYSSYLSILKSQTELEFFGLKKQNELKNTLKKLIKKVYSNKEFIFNGTLVNSQYFKDLFEIKPNPKSKISENTKVFVMTGSYDSEIDSKNGWFLYSNIKNNNVKHKEFIALSHYFYKIPYKSFAFSYNKNLKIDREFLKELKRFLRK